MSEQLYIGPGSWYGLGGLYSYPYSSDEGEHTGFFYIINGNRYDANDLASDESIGQSNNRLLPGFTIDRNGSQLIAVATSGGEILYQQQSNGQFIELTPRPNINNQELLNISVLVVPLPNGTPSGIFFPQLPLRDISNHHLVIYRLERIIRESPLDENTFTRILGALNSNLERSEPPLSISSSIINSSSSSGVGFSQMAMANALEQVNRSGKQMAQPIIEPQETLFKESYETLVKQLYGIPVQLPDFLIINGLTVSIIRADRINSTLAGDQIERWIIDPLLQPWAGAPGTPYRIFTLFTKSGVTYLIKGRYDQRTNQILP